MTKKTLKQLVDISIKNNNLDEKTVYKVAELLNRHELKRYIHELKTALRKKTVTVVTSKPLSQSSKSLFESTYPNKRLEFTVKQDILLGLQIIDNDTIYDTSLKNTFNEITRYIAD